MMRAEVVHVTDHAILRWRERAAKHAFEGVDEIISTVRQSRILKKNEPLPYPMPRLPNSVYSVKDEILFVLESVSIKEYRLVTVITQDIGVRLTPKQKPRNIRFCSDKVRIEHRRNKDEKIKAAVVEKPSKEEKNEARIYRKKLVQAQKKDDREVVKQSICYRLPVILTPVERTLVRNTMLNVAQKLGLEEEVVHPVILSSEKSLVRDTMLGVAQKLGLVS